MKTTNDDLFLFASAYRTGCGFTAEEWLEKRDKVRVSKEWLMLRKRL